MLTLIQSTNARFQSAIRAIYAEHGNPAFLTSAEAPELLEVNGNWRKELAALCEHEAVEIPKGAVENEEGRRICRVDKCGRVLVKKPGRGRWPVECRSGEGCKG